MQGFFRIGTDSPTPSPTGECVPPFGSGEGTHSLTGEGVCGGGGSSDEGTDNVVL
jgi:hypothetical protein